MWRKFPNENNQWCGNNGNDVCGDNGRWMAGCEDVILDSKEMSHFPEHD